MPAYDYRCRGCDGVFEVIQRISDPVGATCPRCGSEECVRQFAASAFQLKGSGWYASDYKNKSAPKPESAPAPCGAPACPSGGCSAASEA